MKSFSYVFLVIFFSAQQAMASAPCLSALAVPKIAVESMTSATAGIMGDSQAPRSHKRKHHKKLTQAKTKHEGPSFDDLAAPDHVTSMDSARIPERLLNLFNKGSKNQDGVEDAKMRLDILYVVGQINELSKKSDPKIPDAITKRDFEIVRALDKAVKVDPAVVSPTRAVETRMWMSLSEEARNNMRSVAAKGYRAEDSLKQRWDLAKKLADSTCLVDEDSGLVSHAETRVRNEDQVFDRSLLDDPEFAKIFSKVHGEYIMRVSDASYYRTFKSIFWTEGPRKQIPGSNSAAPASSSALAEH